MNKQIMDLGFQKEEPANNAMMDVTESRAMHEVQAAYVIAKKFPRNQHQSYMDIIEACKRPFLAEQAMYAYPRGGSLIRGPSIRLAETLAQAWGNIDFGIREISQTNGMSIAEAYAIDLQTNTRVTKIFHVVHARDSKKGKTQLTDARDIYEVVANNGSRRLRACILGIIPGDVVEAAIEQCEKTLHSSEVPIDDLVKILLVSFNDVGVKPTDIEKRLGHPLDKIILSEIITLKSILKSIKDGVADRSQFFDFGQPTDINSLGKNNTEKLNTILNVETKTEGDPNEIKNTDEKISDEQIDLITSLLQEKAFDEERMAKIRAHYKFNNIEDLLKINANRLIKYLKEKT